MFEQFKEDIQTIMERDPAAKSPIQIFFFYPGFKAVRMYRKAHKYYVKKHFFRAHWLTNRMRKKTGIEIHPGATIGKRLFIDHGAGIVIGETSVIGDDVTLYQGVTLGGTGKESGKRHPTLGNYVTVGAGAKVLGSITVGNNSKIGAGAIVLKNVPKNSTVVGNPGRIVEKKRTSALLEVDLDQVNLPDPAMEQYVQITSQLNNLTACIRQCETLSKVFNDIQSSSEENQPTTITNKSAQLEEENRENL